MSADTYTRQGDFTDDEAANTAGRSTVRTALLDTELDAIATAITAHASDLDVLLRDDGKMVEDVLQGHEFSDAAVTLLSGLIGTNTALVWRGSWVTATAYVVGNLVEDSNNAYICIASHTAGATFAGDAANWDLFASSGYTLPTQSGGTNERVLISKGSDGSEAWGYVTTTQAPTLAPLASPTFTGTTTVAQCKATVGSVSYGAPVLTVNPSTSGGTFMSHTFTTETVMTLTMGSNVAGAFFDLRIINGTGDITVTLGGAYKLMGIAPLVIPENKTSVISGRCYGTSATDWIISAVSEE